MLLKNKSSFSDFFRRLKFYVFGFLLGTVVVSFLFKGRGGCKMPGTVKIEELASQKIVYSHHANCRMKCRNISEQDVKKILLEGKINYSKSDVQDKPCATFAVEGDSENGKNLRIIVADCDTISKIVTAIDLSLETDTCTCK